MNPCNIKNAISILHKCFTKYAGQDGDKNTMSKAEVAKMFKEEFPEIAAACEKQPAAVADMFNMLDEDGNGTVDFQEYVVLVATMCLVQHGC